MDPIASAILNSCDIPNGNTEEANRLAKRLAQEIRVRFEAGLRPTMPVTKPTLRPTSLGNSSSKLSPGQRRFLIGEGGTHVLAIEESIVEEISLDHEYPIDRVKLHGETLVAYSSEFYSPKKLQAPLKEIDDLLLSARYEIDRSEGFLEPRGFLSRLPKTLLARQSNPYRKIPVSKDGEILPKDCEYPAITEISSWYLDCLTWSRWLSALPRYGEPYRSLAANLIPDIDKSLVFTNPHFMIITPLCREQELDRSTRSEKPTT